MPQLFRTIVLTTALTGAAQAQSTAPLLPTKDLASQAVSYEPSHLRFQLTSPLAVTGAHGIEWWPAGTALLQTRSLRTANDDLAYVVAERTGAYGLVTAAALALHSSAAGTAPAAAPSGFLAALAAIPGGRSHRDSSGKWLENSGFRRLPASSPPAVALTVDLCPNFQRFEHALFDELIALGKARGRPVPVTAFVSGYWLKGSPKRRAQEVQTLLALTQSPDLDLVIANHSLTHPYLKGAVSLARNFLLKPGIDFKRETLGNELEILQAGFIPAPWFRFPGLISNEALETTAASAFSLLTVGKGSWPGTGEAISLGDVVLVHGNGGEPAGVRIFISWLREHHSAIVGGRIDLVGPRVLLSD